MGGPSSAYGIFELALSEAWRGRRWINGAGKITGLPFPAGAEIVLEGFVTPRPA